MANSPHINLDVNDTFTKQTVRFRTVGDITCTAAVSSTASTIDEVIEEIKASRITERGLRIDDQQSEAAMEDRKKVGYF
jgi:sulfate adenylyltransferase subunit 2